MEQLLGIGDVLLIAPKAAENCRTQWIARRLGLQLLSQHPGDGGAGLLACGDGTTEQDEVVEHAFVALQGHLTSGRIEPFAEHLTVITGWIVAGGDH